MKGKLKQVKGITLIALVITIIVLLILAGVSIAMLTGQNGILTQANNAKVEQSHGAVREGISLAYNEYQIEINTASNTKLASTETVQIQGKEEKALASYSSFLDFLNSKGYIKEGTTDVLDVEALTGSRQALGNGTDTDVYKIEEQDGNYVVNYYDEPTNPEQIWSISGSTSTGDVTLEPDTGKDELILVYNVDETDKTVYLPVGGQEYNYNFQVDWGDGSEVVTGITNSSIVDKRYHEYYNSGIYTVKIKGIFEEINGTRGYGADLIKVEQWGTTGLKAINFYEEESLTEIVSPTESSFKNLEHVNFRGAGIKSIPDKMFLNCNIGSFNECFWDCTGLEEIGDYVFLNCSNAFDFAYCFQDCINLTSIGEGVFDGCDNVTSFGTTFSGCSNLQGKAPELWLRVPDGEENGYIGVPNGSGCFAGCEKLDNYEEIPDYWKTVIYS